MKEAGQRAKRPQRLSGWTAFGATVVVGMLLAFSFLSFAGPLAWPFILILGAILIWLRPPVRAGFGLVSDIGVFLLFIGVIHLQDTPCPPSGIVISADFSGVSSCGGLDSRPWLIVGSVVFVAGIGLFAAARQRATRG